MSGDSGLEGHGLVPPHGDINIALRNVVQFGNGALVENIRLLDLLVRFSVGEHHIKSYVIRTCYFAAYN